MAHAVVREAASVATCPLALNYWPALVNRSHRTIGGQVSGTAVVYE